MKHVDIFTDGACSGNPGPGGWGAVLRYGEVEKELSGGEAETTNNRMELMAAISALNALKSPCEVDLYTDSAYVKDGITKWIFGWKRRAGRRPITSQSRMSSCGRRWKRRRNATRSPCIGSRAMPVILKTSAPTNWRERAWSPSNGGNGSLLYLGSAKIEPT